MQDLIAGRYDYMAEQTFLPIGQIRSCAIKAFVTFGLEQGPAQEDIPDDQEGWLR